MSVTVSTAISQKLKLSNNPTKVLSIDNYVFEKSTFRDPPISSITEKPTNIFVADGMKNTIESVERNGFVFIDF